MRRGADQPLPGAGKETDSPGGKGWRPVKRAGYPPCFTECACPAARTEARKIPDCLGEARSGKRGQHTPARQRGRLLGRLRHRRQRPPNAPGWIEPGRCRAG